MRQSLLLTSLRLALLACATLPWSPAAQAAATDQARFGERVALEGQLLLVGAPEQDGSGRLYVFAMDGGAWRLQQLIEPDAPCAGCAFAASVAIDGTRLAVGEPGSGSVFVYRSVQGLWSREARLRDAQNPGLGAAVAISGESVAAGSADGQPVSVFVRDAIADDHPWLLQARLAPGTEHAHFGSALAFEGELLMVGDPAPRSTGGRGTLHAFERDGDDWGDAQLLDQAENAGDGFGRTLALLGDTAIVGVENARRAHVYTRDATRWRRSATLQSLQSSDGLFGAAVGLSPVPGSDQLQAIVGAPLAPNGTRRATGMAQVHRGRGATWSAGLMLQPSNERDAHAGWDVAAAGDLLAIGIPDLDREGVDRGGVAVHTAAGEGWSLPLLLDSEVEGASNGPVIEPVAGLAFDEGTHGTLRLRFDDSDTPSDALAVVVQSTDPDLLGDDQVVVQNAAGGRRVDLEPAADAYGQLALLVRVGDGRTVATQRIPVQIRAVNDAPAFALAASPAFAPRPVTGPRLVQDFVRDFQPGPRETDQTIAAGLLQEVADPDGVVNDIAIVPAIGGRTAHLSLALSGRSGIATFDVRIRDSGGVENGGQDLSGARRFTVTVAADPSALFFDGFE
jgi:hypothetical protein